MAREDLLLTENERQFIAEALLDDVISSFENTQTAPDGWERRCMEGSILQFRQGLYEDACVKIATAAALVARRPLGTRSAPCLRSDVSAIRKAFEAARRPSSSSVSS